MKKSLFAIAAMTAFAGAAQAQSTVTVYGIIDAGYIGSNAKEGTNGASKITKSAFGQSAEQTSRLGFRGTEDLGGGASAFFTVELGLTPQNSELSGGTAEDRIQRTTNGSGSAVDNRQSFVGLKKNGLGQFAFGRQYTPVFNTGATTSPGQYNNVVGDVVYNGSSSAYFSSATTASGNNNGLGFTNRVSNSLSAKSDNFAGLEVAGMYAMNNQNQTLVSGQTVGTTAASGVNGGGDSNWGGWGLSANFTGVKNLYIGAAYQSFKTNYSTGIVSSAAIVNLGSPAATSGQLIASGVLFPAAQISDKQTLVGATYDFGILKAYAQWVGRKVTNSAGVASTLGETVNRTAQQIGVRSYITPTIEAWASAGNGKYKGAPLSATVTAPTVNFVGYQLGGNYYLSKRTNLYAIYGQTGSSSATPNTVGSGNTLNQYSLGMRHTF
jgi:predicted porin